MGINWNVAIAIATEAGAGKYLVPSNQKHQKLHTLLYNYTVQHDVNNIYKSTLRNSNDVIGQSKSELLHYKKENAKGNS